MTNADKYQIETKNKPTFFFIGVTTGSSSINKVFPLWMPIFGHPDVVLEGIDCKIHDDPEVYRSAVAQIKFDPQSLGALVTTHKIDLFEAARDMFDYVDPYAKITHEVSSISLRDGQLEGHAKDPITAGKSMDHILGENYFGKNGGWVMIIGAGGSGTATCLHLINKEDPADRPEKIIVVNRSKPRLEKLSKMVETLDTDIKFEFIQNQDPKVNDEIMATLPERSIVINATGMGKDIPGSPITDEGVFPMNGIAWEFNYRGELDFLHQAEAQQEARQLTVEDGWVYFIHGWSQVIGQVFHMEITPELFNQLEKAARKIRK
jgi:shikimate 5-dehydrogenase